MLTKKINRIFYNSLSNSAPNKLINSKIKIINKSIVFQNKKIYSYKNKIYIISIGKASQSLLKGFLKFSNEIEDYLRAKSYYKNNNYYVTPFALQDSSMTFYLSEADSLIIRKPYDKALKKGDEVSIIQLINLNNNNI